MSSLPLPPTPTSKPHAPPCIPSTQPLIDLLASNEVMLFTPPGKAKNRQPVEVTWMYADCLVCNPEDMTAKQIHDGIMKEISGVYSVEQMSRILWCRQLLDDDRTVELTVYKDALYELSEVWRKKFGLGLSRLDLNEGPRNIHDPFYWKHFLETGGDKEMDESSLIRKCDVISLARAWVVCQSKLVKTYLYSRCNDWHQDKTFYTEVGTYRKTLQHGMKFPDQP